MKKKWWLLTIICSNLFAYNFKTVEQEAINHAASSIKKELELRYRKRYIVTTLIAAGGAAGIYVLWKNWPQINCPTLESYKPENYAKEAEKASLNWLASLKKDVKGVSWFMVKQVPSVLVFSSIGNGAFQAVAHLFSWGEKFYRPLDWEWLINDYVYLPYRLNALKYTAALLDPNSELFTIFKDIKISWSENISVFHGNEQQHPVSFDELVKLCLIAQRKIEIKQKGALPYEKLIEQYWNSVVESITYCLGYIQYKSTIAVDVIALEKNQLNMSQEEIINSTRRLAQELPELLKDNQQKSNGLLAAIYEYCNNVQHMCAILDKNSILEA